MYFLKVSHKLTNFVDSLEGKTESLSYSIHRLTYTRARDIQHTCNAHRRNISIYTLLINVNIRLESILGDRIG